MSESLRHSGIGTAAPGRTHTLFAQTMGYVAVTAGFFALGSYLGHNLSYGWAFVWFMAPFACLIGMNFAVRRSGALAAGLLVAFGVLLGLAMAPTLVYYANANPQVLWQAGGATALVIAGFGAAGYATRRDLQPGQGIDQGPLRVRRAARSVTLISVLTRRHWPVPLTSQALEKRSRATDI